MYTKNSNHIVTKKLSNFTLLDSFIWVECGARTHEALSSQARNINYLTYNRLNLYFIVFETCQMTQY